MAVIYWACNVNGKRLGHINMVVRKVNSYEFEDSDLELSSTPRFDRKVEP